MANFLKSIQYGESSITEKNYQIFLIEYSCFSKSKGCRRFYTR